MIAKENIESIVEAILFSSDRPVSLKEIEAILGVGSNGDGGLAELKAILESIRSSYQKESHGIYLEEVAGGYHFRTKMDKAPWIKKFLQSKPQRMSRAQLETLSIIAYKQPVTRIEIDEIRGVDSSHLIKVLLDKKLIKIIGVKEAPGRPLIYATTSEFLEFFNLKEVKDLPSLEQIKELQEKNPQPLPLFNKETLDMSDVLNTHSSNFNKSSGS